MDGPGNAHLADGTDHNGVHLAVEFSTRAAGASWLPYALARDAPSKRRWRDQDMWVSPEIPSRRSTAASSTMIAAAINLASRTSQSRTRSRNRVARSGDTASMMSATASGSSDTTEKNTHSTMYSLLRISGPPATWLRSRVARRGVRGACCAR